MADLIDATYMRETFKIHKDVGDKRIDPYIAVALIRLEKWVGADNYADANLAVPMKIAAGTLTMHYLIPNLNTNIRTKGLVATETVEGNVTVRYLNPIETGQAETAYLERARELVDAFILASDLPPAPEIVTNV